MSFEIVGLGKLLSVMYADKARRKSMLRSDIRSEMNKESGLGGNLGGGDFYGPFWADAKRHVSGELDLRAATASRITSNEKSRNRLYPLLRDGFLIWWEEKRRLRNVPFKIIDTNVKARYDSPGQGTIKIENTLCITVGDDGHRIFYPYFREEPVLADEAARVGLYIMSECIKEYQVENMRIIDIINSRSFSVIDTPLKGNEKQIFLDGYEKVLEDWRALRSEY